MASDLTANPRQVTRRIEEVSGIRPVTLLIASGIVLIIAILLVTGIAANHLRDQALATAEGDLARVDTVFAEAGNRTLMTIDGRLDDIAGGLGTGATDSEAGFTAAAAGPSEATALARQLKPFPQLDAVALLATDGSVVNRAGAWPVGNETGHAVIAALRRQPQRVTLITTAGQRAGVPFITLIRRIDGPTAMVGAVAGLIPVSDFTSLFAAVPLQSDAVVALLGPNGSILANYPDRTGPDNAGLAGTPLNAILGSINATIRHVTGDDGKAQIEALRAFPSYPAAVVVRRSADQVLTGWAYQGLWLGGFALVLCVAIAIMVYLIAGRFQNQVMFAALRTERIEAEKIESERARLAVEAELLKKERLSVLGQLTATVAHELRNPLSAIRNTLFTVRELATNAGVRLDRPLSRMERSIERCDRIIADLLEYTRQRDLKRTAVRFDRWLGDLLAEQSTTAPIVVAQEVSAGDVSVEIDPDRFRRVVINLIENATHAVAETPPERDKRIVVRTAIVDRELVLVIADTGPGIKPENLERIFEPLFSTKTFGTGLGLPTVKQIVDQHDGVIEVESEIGKGTRVIVKMPLAPALAKEEKIAA